MTDDATKPTAESLEYLVETWQETLASVGVFLTSEEDETIHIARDEYDELLRRIASNDDYYRLLQTARTWVHPPLSKILEIKETNTRQLARRFGKEIQPDVLDHGLRLPAGSLRSFFVSLVHVASNAVDHGLEDPVARVALGKPRVGRVTLETRIEHGACGVIVADDGCGIDGDRVRKNAARMSVPVTTEEQLIMALGGDGLSTKETVTDISRRGVGMSAVYRSCKELGGTVKVISERGKGSRFEFWFALDAIKHSVMPGVKPFAASGVHRSAPPVTTVQAANKKQ